MTENEKEDIKVEDKRHFDREGNPIRTEDKTEAKAAQSQEDPDVKAQRGPAPGSQTAEKIDFIAVLFTYVHTALIYLGDVEDPAQKKPSENLDGARQMIEILELVQGKTKGNLTKQEEQYLESALFDLRMRYMQKTKLIK